MECEVSDLGFGVSGFGYEVWSLMFGVWSWGLGLVDSGFDIGLRFRIPGFRSLLSLKLTEVPLLL